MLVNSTQIRPTVITFNAKQDRTSSAVASDLSWIAANWAPDLAGLQEMGGYSDVLASLPTGYAYAAPEEIAPSAFHVRKNAIVYKTSSFVLRESHSMLLVSQSVSAGFGTMMCNFARFQDTTDGNFVWFHNGHVDPSYSAAGVPIPGAKSAAVVQAVETFAKTVTAHVPGDQLVLWCGDWNVDWFTDVSVHNKQMPYSVFKKYGLVNLFTPLGTPSTFSTFPATGSALDWIGYHKSDQRTSAYSVIESGSALTSDHRAVQGLVNITRIPGMSAPPDIGKPATCIN